MNFFKSDLFKLILCIIAIIIIIILLSYALTYDKKENRKTYTVKDDIEQGIEWHKLSIIHNDGRVQLLGMIKSFNDCNMIVQSLKDKNLMDICINPKEGK